MQFRPCGIRSWTWAAGGGRRAAGGGRRAAGGGGGGDDDDDDDDDDTDISANSSYRRRQRQQELLRELQRMQQDNVERSRGRQIAGVTHTNTITTTYKDGGTPTVSRTSSRVSNWEKMIEFEDKDRFHKLSFRPRIETEEKILSNMLTKTK